MQHWADRENRRGSFRSLQGGRREEGIQPALLDVSVSPAVLKPSQHFAPHLVSLVVEPDPGDSGVARASEAEDLLGVTPLEHPHAAILSSRQVYKQQTSHHFPCCAPISAEKHQPHSQ